MGLRNEIIGALCRVRLDAAGKILNWGGTIKLNSFLSRLIGAETGLHKQKVRVTQMYINTNNFKQPSSKR